MGFNHTFGAGFRNHLPEFCHMLPDIVLFRKRGKCRILVFDLPQALLERDECSRVLQGHRFSSVPVDENRRLLGPGFRILCPVHCCGKGCMEKLR